MRILLVNDDGYDAPGIRALRDALASEHEVWVVAPDREVSAVGHAITLRSPLRARRVGPRTWRVEGNPTDCVNLALWRILPGRPDFLVSGVNQGWNLSEDVTYSGTVAGAMEGAVHRIPSVAVSAPPAGVNGVPLCSAAAAWVARNLPRWRDWDWPPHVFLNINWPNRLRPRGVRWTRLGRRAHPNEVEERRDPRGEIYYWLTRGEPVWEGGGDLDVKAVQEGFVSVTPLSIDWTDETFLKNSRGGFAEF